MRSEPLAALNWLARRRAVIRYGRATIIAVPFLALVALFLFPFLIILKISISHMDEVAVRGLITLQAGRFTVDATPANYVAVVRDGLYLGTFLTSLKYAAITTLLCLII